MLLQKILIVLFNINRAFLLKINTMGKHRTAEEFINDAKKVHGDKYDYSKAIFTRMADKVTIICPEHGAFEQRAIEHLEGSGCPKCALQKRTMTKEDFIARANIIHHSKYDYSKVVYVNTETKVCIICPEHGEFWQTPHMHLDGQGCPKCGMINSTNKRTKRVKQFITEAQKIHGNKYDYSKVEYSNNKTKVCIICPKHGEFWMTPNQHLSQKQGCPFCAGHIRKTNEEFIADAQKIHGNKYDYSKVNYINNRTNVTVTCPIHGDFNVCPDNHLAGNGCPKCAGKHRTSEELIQLLRDARGDEYDYSLVGSESMDRTYHIPIICKKHGIYRQNLYTHLSGAGCPICGNGMSNNEFILFNYIKGTLGFTDALSRVRGMLSNPAQELDIYIPSKKIAIEYDGLIWHSDKFNKVPNYHLKKTEECKSKGIRLIHIFEDEMYEHKDIVLSKIKHILGCDGELPMIMGRKCIIKNILFAEASQFLNRFHIQGSTPSTVYLGAFYDDKLVAVMSFKKEKTIWELNRFATDTSYRIPGIASKLFTYFRHNYDYTVIKSFLDRRWNIEGNTLYEKLGFEIEKIEKPDYYYVDGKKRLHKFGFRKQILSKKYNLPETMTETEMTKQLGLYKIWNCGLVKYIYKKE